LFNNNKINNKENKLLFIIVCKNKAFEF